MRLRSFPLFLALAAGAVGLVIAAADKEKPESAPKTKPGAAPKAEPKVVAGKTEEKEAEAAVAESGARFVVAYNRHDAKAIAAGFTATAEFATEDARQPLSASRLAVSYSETFENRKLRRDFCRRT